MEIYFEKVLTLLLQTTEPILSNTSLEAINVQGNTTFLTHSQSLIIKLTPETKCTTISPQAAAVTGTD